MNAEKHVVKPLSQARPHRDMPSVYVGYYVKTTVRLGN